MSKKSRLGNQKGFTLIEVIAVLLLLGILAAVAVPKFFDMQEETELQTLKIALNDMKSRAVLQYSKSVLANDGEATVADQATFDDIGLVDDDAVNDAYRDFLGAWDRDGDATGLTIDYDMNYGTTTYTFTLTPGTISQPIDINMN